jgi:hypothetical protein
MWEIRKTSGDVIEVGFYFFARSPSTLIFKVLQIFGHLDHGHDVPRHGLPK